MSDLDGPGALKLDFVGRQPGGLDPELERTAPEHLDRRGAGYRLSAGRQDFRIGRIDGGHGRRIASAQGGQEALVARGDGGADVG